MWSKLSLCTFLCNDFVIMGLKKVLYSFFLLALQFRQIHKNRVFFFFCFSIRVFRSAATFSFGFTLWPTLTNAVIFPWFPWSQPFLHSMMGHFAVVPRHKSGLFSTKKKVPCFHYSPETKATRVFASRISVFFLAPPAININKGISTCCGNFLFALWHGVQFFLSHSEIICQGIESFWAFEHTEPLS